MKERTLKKGDIVLVVDCVGDSSHHFAFGQLGEVYYVSKSDPYYPIDVDFGDQSCSFEPKELYAIGRL